MRPMPMRIATLASGSGTNLQAVLDHLAALGDQRAAGVVLVASDRPDAGALERARDHGIAAVAMDAGQQTSGLLALLREHQADLVLLAGYLRLVPTDVVAAFRGRIVNIHPALLPAFGGPGMFGQHVHAAVIAAGARVSGVTVHFVDEQYDHGPIIAQWPVPVFPDDTPPTLARRILQVEHLVYPRVVQALAAGRIALADDGTVHQERRHEFTHFALVTDPGAAIHGLDALL